MQIFSERVRRILDAALSVKNPEEREKIIARARDIAAHYIGDAYVAIQAPRAWRTWEAKTTLLGTNPNEAPGGDIEYPWPVEVVGMFPVVTPLRPNVPNNGLLVVPTLDDVLIAVSWDQNIMATASQEQTSTAGRSSFVTASALGTRANPRVWGVKLRAERPVLSFSWKWKQGADIFVDSVVSVATFIRPLKDLREEGMGEFA